jgi:hypothetical protein
MQYCPAAAACVLLGPEGLNQYVRAFRNYASSFQLEQREIGAPRKATSAAGGRPLALIQKQTACHCNAFQLQADLPSGQVACQHNFFKQL